MTSPVRCAVLGDPVDHSLSPVLHRAAYDALGLAQWSYDAVRVPAGTLATFLDGLDDSWRGLSLTMPLKRELLPLAGEVSERARLVGAANTLVLGPDVPVGGLADNTDLPGAAAAVRERWAGAVADVVVLGGGATAASTALALCDLGATRVRILARAPERAADTVAAVAAHPGRPDVQALALPDARVRADVVVSTVPVAAQVPALLDRIEAPVVFEVLYDPWPTPLAAATLERGAVLVGGLDLLVHQAALQVALFTGREAPLETMRQAGERALRERSGRP
ncbi:Shikimate dehydrogenase [Nocardioides dokdonensis FR1436]|uniref:Shikimate dehydrogenase n=1 Tax=Nocardioides dokdonensis FR1436 TaxID=1300347 RepID=A0A1A9GP15_9ACTN|nr:shikimate dehydrogenase [Nocardioides dokdonensis]ANH39402.1 Shikimate dehydrogenase [Nocardioides dokdonensis FR1436]